MKKIGKVKGRGKIKGLDFGKGWYNESVRHGLASRGILTGRKREEPEIEKTKTTDIKPLKELTARGFVVAAIQFAPIPMARELYIGYGTARLVYSSWSMIYNAYKNPNTLKQETYNYTSYQTGLIWDNIEDREPRLRVRRLLR